MSRLFLTVSDFVSPEKLKRGNGCSIEKAHRPNGNNIPETHINVIFYNEGVFPEYPCDFTQTVLNTDLVSYRVNTHRLPYHLEEMGIFFKNSATMAGLGCTSVLN